MSSNYTNVFGGTSIYPSDVSYLALTLTADVQLQWPLEANVGNNLVARIIDVEQELDELNPARKEAHKAAVAETEVAIDALVSVRDKVIAAYEEIMKMPI